MTCKIDHGVDGAIPPSLCRTCNPADPDEALLRAAAPADISPRLTEAPSSVYRRRRRRKLRAEVKERSEFLDKLRAARASKAEIDKAERGWKSAYAELATLEDPDGL